MGSAITYNTESHEGAREVTNKHFDRTESKPAGGCVNVGWDAWTFLAFPTAT